MALPRASAPSWAGPSLQLGSAVLKGQAVAILKLIGHCPPWSLTS